MSNVMTPTTRTVRFWACGGTGIDLLRDYREAQGLTDPDLYSEEHYSYIDTSDSNMHGLDKSSANEVYRVKGTDGGGKDREFVKTKFIPVLAEVMMTFPAGDMNVLVGSPSGGTGSACIPQIAKELLKAGESVAVVLVADHTSSTSSANCIMCLTELEQLTQLTGKSIAIHWSTNDRKKSHLDNGTEAKFVMAALSLLGSGKNHKLDSSDIRNFLDYTTITHHKAGLGNLRVTNDISKWAGIGQIATFAALLGDELATVPEIEADYDAVGFLPAGAKNPYDTDLFFSVTLGMNSVIDELVEIRKSIEMKRKVAVQTSSLLDGNSLGGSGISL